MLEDTKTGGAAPLDIGRFLSGGPIDSTLVTERLPFTVRMVSSSTELAKAVSIRHAAYTRHVPQFAQSLATPEVQDNEAGFVVLLAESKIDGSPLGTMRIQVNRFRPLVLEQSVELPEWLRHRRLAEATRLGVIESRVGRLVTTVLFKAFYLYCMRNSVEWMVVAGRSPIDRQYDRLMFADVYPELGYIPLAHAGNLLHRVMSFDVPGAQDLWQAAAHPLYNFIVRTNHPDIDVGPARTWGGQAESLKVQNFSTVLGKIAVKNL